MFVEEGGVFIHYRAKTANKGKSLKEILTVKQLEESINNLKENEAAKTGNNDNAENVDSLQQNLRKTGRILVNALSEEEIEYICMKIRTF